MRFGTLFAGLALGAVPAPAAVHAQSILARPAACVPILTIQKRGCEVETQYRCPDGASHLYRSEEFTSEGLDGVEHTRADYALIAASDGLGEFEVRAVAGSDVTADPAQVVASGSGRVEQLVEIDLWGITRPAKYSMKLRADPETTLIEGVAVNGIDVTFTLSLPEPMPDVRGTGRTYFHAPSGALFLGETTITLFPDDTAIPNAPAKIILPGQPGFESSQPQFDCGEFSSAPGWVAPAQSVTEVSG